MNLPIKKAVFNPNDPNMGLKMISLVEDPAIQVQWIKFSKDEEIKLAIQDEEQRIIFTPVLIPNQLIYRNMNGEEFNLTFDSQTIQDVAVKWSKDNLSTKVDEEHSGQLIPGVVFFESFILSKQRASTAKGFENLPEGTWFVTGKVESDEVWQDIKDGKVKGVSIDGIFQTMMVKASEAKQEVSDEVILNLLKNILYHS